MSFLKYYKRRSTDKSISENTESVRSIENKRNYRSFVKAMSQSLLQVEFYDKKFHNYTDNECKEQKILFIECVCDILRKDLFYEYVVHELEVSQNSVNSTPAMPTIYPEKYEPIKFSVDEEFNPNGKCIFVWYRKPQAISDEITRLNSNLSIDGGWYNYYQYLGLGCAGSDGHHRLIVSNARNTAIKSHAEVYDDSVCMERLFTDGSDWFDSPDRTTPIGEVYDWKVAALFTLVKSLYLKDFSILR